MTKIDDANREAGRAIRALNDVITRSQSSTNTALRRIALAIERSAKKKVPREYGNLAGSGYHQKVDTGGYEIGFTAEYAAYVHENLEQKLKGQARPSGLGKYWGPKGEPRFLSKAVDEVSKDALAIIRDQNAKDLKRKTKK